MLVVAGLLRRQGRILICRRGSGRFAGLWEFPGGKCEAGESEPEALRRELREELGIECRVGRLFARVRHRYPETIDGRGAPLGYADRPACAQPAGAPREPQPAEIEIAFYEIAAFAGEPRDVGEPPLFAAIEWAEPARLGSYAFLPADVPVLELLQAPAGQ